jgi:hypothetical protein
MYRDHYTAKEMELELNRTDHPKPSFKEHCKCSYFCITKLFLYLYFLMKVKKAANRPLKYGEPTQLVQFRVPKSKVSVFKKLVAAILKRWL